MEAPFVKRAELALMDIDDEGFLSLMDEDGGTKSDLKLPEGDLGKEIQAAFEGEDDRDILLTIQEALGEEAAVGWKFDTK
jgi:translation initiation factor 5A